MSRRLAFLVIALFLAQGSLAFIVRAATQAAADRRLYHEAEPAHPSAVQHLALRPDGLDFILEVPEYEITAAGLLESGLLDPRLSEPGAPALPYYSAFIALPPEATVEMTVLPTAESSEKVGLLAAASAAVSDSQAGLSDTALFAPQPVESTTPDAAVYRSDLPYPDALYSVSAPMYVRDLRLVEVRLFPFRYRPASGTLIHARQIAVSISFQGADTGELHPAPTPQDSYLTGLKGHILNFDQAQGWRSLPRELVESAANQLPIGQDSYKIELDQDGIYEISGADLAAAGMNISSVNPATLEMMYRGNPVAFQFIGDGDAVLEPTERIRFYGWAFNGPRTEKQFISKNVFWLWAGGTPAPILTATNEAGLGHPVVNDVLHSVTREPENHFFATWMLWDFAPNEPDAWFWDYIKKPPSTLTLTYGITLPYPVADTSTATYLVEVSSRLNLLPPSPPHAVRAFINADPSFGSAIWYGINNVNITNSVAVTNLVHGPNNVQVVAMTNGRNDRLYLNRITVDYRRQMVATGNELGFIADVSGSREFRVSGFTEPDSARTIVWDVSVPWNPVQISMRPADVTGTSGSYTYTFGTTRPTSGAHYWVSTIDNILTSTTISQYTAPSLDPPSGAADWLAISHQDFVTEARRLANHRSLPGFGGLATHVVDNKDVINQYGYGLPLPAAIKAYLSHALATWTRAPGYVVLFGDATQNPRNLDCPVVAVGGGCAYWDKDEPTYLITDLVFEDRFQGLIPSDQPFVLLSGNDPLADMAIGRFPVSTITEAVSVVDKVIQYDQIQVNVEPWLQNVLFVADNKDDGGDFCAENANTGGDIHPYFIQTHLCLDPAGPISTPAVLTPLMATAVNNVGVSLFNYRGHGSVDSWASELILTSNDIGFWANQGKPVLVLSADCLDGHFAWPGQPGLGEVFLELQDRGTVAHWSSSGLGFTSEHTILHSGFYQGIFAAGLTAIGDAINFSKLNYYSTGHHESELYSFVLIGDPAMQLYRPDLHLQKRALQAEASPGTSVRFTIAMSNTGLYPTHVVVTDTLPVGLSFVSASANGPFSVNLSTGDIRIELLTPIDIASTGIVTVTASITTTFAGTAVNTASATNSGINISGASLITDTASIYVSNRYFVPVVSRP